MAPWFTEEGNTTRDRFPILLYLGRKEGMSSTIQFPTFEGAGGPIPVSVRPGSSAAATSLASTTASERRPIGDLMRRLGRAATGSQNSQASPSKEPWGRPRSIFSSPQVVITLGEGGSRTLGSTTIEKGDACEKKNSLH